jgi:DNA-binding GntR family transcriptional regulator
MQETQPKRSDDAGSLAESAYRRIEEMIVLRELPPGAMISESRLGEELGCGRTPIREALLRLKHEGFIEVYPSRGAMVAPSDILKQLELLEVRRPLEDLVVRLAAKRATQEERAEMRGLGAEIKRAAAAGDRKHYLRANRAVHEIKARAARNSMLEKTIGTINGLARRFWYAYIEDTGQFKKAAEMHDKILRKVADGSPDQAAAASGEFLDFLESLSRDAIDRRR